jgi:hypothetical protein
MSADGEDELGGRGEELERRISLFKADLANASEWIRNDDTKYTR